MAKEPGWGGPGVTQALKDDGTDPGPGEEEQDRRTDEWVIRRLVMLEETTHRRGGGGRWSGKGWEGWLWVGWGQGLVGWRRIRGIILS